MTDDDKQAWRPFDAGALYAALDEERTRLAISWPAVAEQLWALSSALNDRRRDHPISPSTLTNMGKTSRTSCQHALFMLRWIRCAPEEFIHHPVEGSTGVGLPVAGPDRRLRWNLRALHGALDARRREEQLTWTSLADLLGCTPRQLTGIRTARFAIGMRLAMRGTQWLGLPAAEFVDAARW